MVWVFAGFGAAFVLGAVLAVIGGAGVELTNCPAIFSGFPAQEPTCKSFSLLVFPRWSYDDNRGGCSLGDFDIREITWSEAVGRQWWIPN